MVIISKVLLLTFLLMSFLILHIVRKKYSPVHKNFSLYLALLVVGGIIYHTQFLSYYIRQGTGFYYFHIPEFYHYYIGAKYFQELGYNGIYEATVIADHEDDPTHFKADTWIRELTTNKTTITRQAVLQDAARIKSSFTGQRWESFKKDIAFFRNLNQKEWSSSRNQIDHGYNGTPFVTFILGALANFSPFDTAESIHLFSWLDTLLMLILFVIVCLRFNFYSGLIFLFFFFANPLNDHIYIGRSFLRYHYFIFIALFMIFFSKNKAISGFCLAYASLLRIFPIFFFISILLFHIVHPKRKTYYKKNKKFYLSFSLTTLLLIILTSNIPTYDGKNPWYTFYNRISAYHSSYSPNCIGLTLLLSYSKEHNIERIKENIRLGKDHDWLAQSQNTFQKRIYIYYLFFILTVIFLFYSYRKKQEEEDTIGPAIFIILITTTIGHYYYSILSLMVLKDKPNLQNMIPLSMLFLGLDLVKCVPNIFKITDLYYSICSLFILLYLFIHIVFIHRKQENSVSDCNTPNEGLVESIQVSA